MPSCTRNGLSRPYCARSCARNSSLRPPIEPAMVSTGSPGEIWISRKFSDTTASSSTAAYTRRRSRKRSMGLLLLRDPGFVQRRQQAPDAVGQGMHALGGEGMVRNHRQEHDGQVGHDQLLEFRVQRLALGGVGLAAGLFEQLIDPGIAVRLGIGPDDVAD